MDCSRCGAAEAVVKRENAFYCGRCALARDWEEVIALVQEERVAVANEPTINFDATPATPPGNGQVATGVAADPFA